MVSVTRSRDRLVAKIKTDVDPRSMLTLLGIEYVDHRETLRATCPNPRHADRRPSWDMGADPERVDGKGGLWYGWHKCMSCGFKGDLIDLVAAVRGMTFVAAVDWIAEQYGLDPAADVDPTDDDYSIPRRRVRREVPAVITMPSAAVPLFGVMRGRAWAERADIPEWQAKRHGLMWDQRAMRILFPVYDRAGRIVDIEARRLDASQGLKAVSASGADHRTPFGANLFDYTSPYAIVVEGFFEYLRLERLGFGTMTLAARTNQIYEELESLLGLVQTVIMLSDADAGGDAMWQEGRRVLRYRSDGQPRRIVRAALPCAGCAWRRQCKLDADDCRRDGWIVDAIRHSVAQVGVEP